jgi:hypothetical protein
MKALALNPWVWLIAAAVLLASVGGGYWWGHTAAATSCKAKAGAATTKVEKVEDRRDENIDKIAAATAGAVAAALNENRGSTDESTERIRTVVVPGACRAVDPGILRELRAARDDANAALGIGVRPGASGADPADP